MTLSPAACGFAYRDSAFKSGTPDRHVILAVTYRQVEELYVQNPAFGFYFLRLVSARLFENLHRGEARVAELTAALAQAQAQLVSKPA